MAGVVRCEVDRQRMATARSAAAWVEAFYPDVTVALDADGACLAADRRSGPALRLIWQTTMVNEALLARGEGGRAAVLEALVR